MGRRYRASGGRRLGGEGFAAAATLRGVGIGNLESAAGQRVGKINHGAAEVIGAEGVHQDGDAEEESR